MELSDYVAQQWSMFRSLPAAERRVVELLAVVKGSVKTVDGAVGLSLKARLVAPSGRRYSKSALLQLVRKLRRSGLLKPRRASVDLDGRLAHEITKAAAKNGRLEQYASALGRFDPRLDPNHNRYWSDKSPGAWHRKLRLVVHSNNADLFAKITSVPEIPGGGQPAAPMRVREVFLGRGLNQLDTEWVESRIPEIRDRGLVGILQYGIFLNGRSYDPGMRLARSVALRPDVSREVWDLALKAEILKGDLAHATQLLAADRWDSAELFRAWIDCISGRRKQAVRRFRSTIGKSPIRDDAWFGPFFVLALIGSGRDDQREEAARFVEAAYPKSAEESLGALLRCVIDRARGKLESARTLLKEARKRQRPQEHVITDLTETIATYWCSENRYAYEARFRRISAETSGFEWLEAEYNALVELEDGEPVEGSQPQEGVGAWRFPLTDYLVAAPVWKASLDALTKVRAKAKKPKRKSAKRLVWLVQLDDDGPWLEALEQVQLKSGRWSKGRKVSIERLVEGKPPRCLTGRDWDVCESIHYKWHQESGRFRYDFAAALAVLAGHPNVFRVDSPTTPVEIVRRDPRVQISSEGDELGLRLVPMPPEDGDTVIRRESDTRIEVTEFLRRHREILEIVGAEGLRLPARNSRELGPAIKNLSRVVTVESDVPGIVPAALGTEADATPVLQITPVGDGLRVVPAVQPFGAKGPFLATGSGSPTVFAHIAGRSQSRDRDLPRERMLLDEVVSKATSLADSNWDGAQWLFDDLVSSLQLLEDLEALREQVKLVWPKGGAFRVEHRASSKALSIRIRSATDWFSLSGRVETDSGLVLTLREMLDAMETSSGRFVPLGDKAFVALSDGLRQRLQTLSETLHKTPKRLRLPVIRTHAIEDVFADVGSLRSDSKWKSHLHRIRHARELRPEVPSTLQAELRDYQTEGFRWGARLAAWGAGACLADDMGLGKTVQALAIILTRASSGPTLVVAPTSVCTNWIDEARRFAPTLRPARFGPGDRAKMLSGAGPYDLIVCSYGLLHHEVSRLSGVPWETLVLDEAQAIKNMETKRWKAAMKLAGGFRMITTGTPIENHLGELYSLLEFINPGLLGKPKEFQSKFAQPIHQRGDQQARQRLRRLIRPFILRRTKSAVLDELPPKTEVMLRIEMSSDERAFYEAVRQSAIDSLAGNGQSNMGILAAITRLRQACCNPKMLAPEVGIPSSKLETLASTVEELVASRHKALVFSQFVKHLAIIRSELDRLGIGYRYLDGTMSPSQRTREIDAFQAGQGDVFLISLRAGGQGLNLTAADYVIHVDPWWNPAVEDQASDRAHRIGQARPVTVYRLVMKDTIEEKIVDLHASKRELAEDLLAGTELTGQMSAEELLALVRDG